MRRNTELEGGWGPDKETTQGDNSIRGWVVETTQGDQVTNHRPDIKGSEPDCDLSKVLGVTAAVMDSFTWPELGNT